MAKQRKVALASGVDGAITWFSGHYGQAILALGSVIVLCILAFIFQQKETRNFRSKPEICSEKTISPQPVEKSFCAVETSKECYEPYEGYDFSFEEPATDRYIEVTPFYMYPKAEGTAFSYSQKDDNTSLPTEAVTNNLSLRPGWGFDIGIGRNFYHQDWDVNLKYSYFKRSSTYDVVSMGIERQLNLLGTQVTNQVFTTTGVDGHFDYDNLSFLLQKKMRMFGNLLFAPGFGVMATWLDLTERYTYTGGAFYGNDALRVNIDSKTWALGPLFSGQGRWLLDSGFYFRSALAGALEYGHAKVNYYERYTPSANNELKVKDKRRAFLPNLGYDLGLGYASYVNDCKQFIEIELGFGGVYWFNGNRTLVFSQFSPPRYSQKADDLSMYGLKARLQIRF